MPHPKQKIELDSSLELGSQVEIKLQQHNATPSSTNFLIQPEKNILSIDLKGTWNEQTTLDFIAEYKLLVNRRFTQEWACVMSLQHLELLLSESFQIESFRALNAWSYIKGMKAAAVIISSNNRSHLLYQFEEIFKVNHPYATAVCHSEIEASQWLNDQGFEQKVIAASQKKVAYSV